MQHNESHNDPAISGSKKHSIKLSKYASKQCNIFKTNLNNDDTSDLYKLCAINQTCRHKKCGNIDNKLYNARFAKWGYDYTKELQNINDKCLSANKHSKATKACERRGILQLHENAGIGELYNKLQLCNRKICSLERKDFKKNLMHFKKIDKTVKDTIHAISADGIDDIDISPIPISSLKLLSHMLPKTIKNTNLTIKEPKLASYSKNTSRSRSLKLKLHSMKRISRTNTKK